MGRTARDYMRQGFQPDDAEWASRPQLDTYFRMVRWGSKAHAHRGVARKVRMAVLRVGCALVALDRRLWRLRLTALP